MVMPPTKLAQRLLAALQEISQKDLAALTGISAPTLLHLTRRAPGTPLHRCTVTKLAKWTGLPRETVLAELHTKVEPAGMKPPNYGPVYAAALYPDLCTIFRQHGYALMPHGSLARDFDLVAVPWELQVSDPEAVLQAVTAEFALQRCAEDPVQKHHGRIAYTLICGFGHCAIDLSFMPRLSPTNEPTPHHPDQGVHTSAAAQDTTSLLGLHT